MVGILSLGIQGEKIMLIWILTGIALGLFVFEFFLHTQNLRYSRSAPIPKEFQDIWDGEKKQKSLNYLSAKGNFHFLQSGVFLFMALVVLHSGIYLALDMLAARTGQFHSFLFVAVLLGISWVLSVPFQWAQTFRLEERFGFNRTNAKTFWLDQFKSLALMLVLAAPVLYLVLYFFTAYGNQAWWIVWIFLTAFQFILGFLAPIFLLPLFFKLSPMPEGELKEKIDQLARKLDFPVAGVFLIDGSKRSSKANAFFTGYGKFRRIVLFDTLIEKHTNEELLAVLAHEIGHAKLKHVPKGIFLSFLTTGVILFVLQFLLRNETLQMQLGFESASVHGGLFLAYWLFSPLNLLLDPIQNGISRKHEFEADRFAVGAMGEGESLIHALKKLSVDQLSNLNPHPWKVWLEYSHPPLIMRLNAIRSQK
jgi:STE24 endopeptidase